MLSIVWALAGIAGTASYVEGHKNMVRMKSRRTLHKTKNSNDVDIPNDGHVQLSTLKKSYKLYLASHSAVLSATVNAQLGPVSSDEYEMTKLEKSIFQEGMEDILRGSIASLDKHDIEILSVIVTSNNLSAQGKGKGKDVLNVQSVVTGQQVLAADSHDSLLTDVEFGEVVSNAAKIFDHELMNEWKEKAEGKSGMIGNDDVIFGHLRHVSMQLYAPDTDQGVGILTIIMSSFIGVLVLCCVYLLIFARRRSLKNIISESKSLVSYKIDDEDSKDGLTPNQNIQDLIRGNAVDFAPYNKIISVPSSSPSTRNKKRRKNRNLYSMLMGRDDDSEDEIEDDNDKDKYEYGDLDRATLPYPDEEDTRTLRHHNIKSTHSKDRFDDHPLPEPSLSKSKKDDDTLPYPNPDEYSHQEISLKTSLSSPSVEERSIATCNSGSMTVVTSTSLQAEGCQLALDGSALKGECFAPPGKLGVAIDTVSGHPVVHRVREDSPLSGVLRRLDVIVAVDEVDTFNMNAADVTSLVAKRMNKKRKIRFLRGRASEDCLVEERK